MSTLQGDEHELLLAPVNSYQRLLQYQTLRAGQFGAAEPPGFYVEVRGGRWRAHAGGLLSFTMPATS